MNVEYFALSSSKRTAMLKKAMLYFGIVLVFVSGLLTGILLTKDNPVISAVPVETQTLPEATPELVVASVRPDVIGGTCLMEVKYKFSNVWAASNRGAHLLPHQFPSVAYTGDAMRVLTLPGIAVGVGDNVGDKVVELEKGALVGGYEKHGDMVRVYFFLGSGDPITGGMQSEAWVDIDDLRYKDENCMLIDT